MTELDFSIAIMKKLNIVKSDGEIKLHGSKLYSCPYHTDKHPSCSIDVEKGIFHCFSCGAGGTLRQAFRDISGESINKALGIPWENQENAEVDRLTQLFGKNDVVEEENFDLVPEVHIGLSGTFVPAGEAKEAKEYLKKRCIPLSVARDMRMKFATVAKSYDLFDSKNVHKQVNFSKRLVIPIYESGRLLSCEGRDVYGKEAFLHKMKVLGNTTAEYKKCIYPLGASTSTLYQYDKLDKSKTLYFVEGLMDLAVLRSDPYFNETNSTAVFGATLSKRQIALLQKFDSFVMILDNDLAGWISLRRLFDSLSKNQFFYQKDWKYVVPPFEQMGVKDVGDIPVKADKTIEDCRNMKWLNNTKKIINSKSIIDKRIEELTKKKKLEESSCR